MKAVLAVVLMLCLAACGHDPADKVELVEVGSGVFAIDLYAEGELRAAESTPIKPPPGSRTPRKIEWMVPDNSWVTRGQVVARFDTSDALRGSQDASIEMSKVEIQMISKQRELSRLLDELGNELDLVDIEKLMAEQFTVDNELAYSRMEIIDAMRDKDLLNYRAGHLEGKKDTYREREGAEEAVLDAAQMTQASKLREHRAQLDNAEVLAPHDGFFVYDKTWFGQKVDIGSTVFPGNKIASIPNLDKMQAVLHVLETEAVGIETGQPVTVTLDAYPDRPLSGRVLEISASATPIERDNPVKYFIVKVALDASDPGWIRPESQVSAVIAVKRVENAIYVPNQSVFSNADGDWVLLSKGGELVRQAVKLGLRGANRSQILSGLKAGARIALYPPVNEIGEAPGA